MAANTTPFNTFKSYLMVGSGSSTITYSKLVDIKEIPDLGSAPPTLDATTLSDPAHVYIFDIEDTGGTLEFTANYTKADYQTVQALEGSEQKLAVWFGATESNGVYTPSGEDGKFPFTGFVTVYKKGASVSGVQEMGIVVSPTSLPELETA